jgi:hypothetical protein
VSGFDNDDNMSNQGMHVRLSSQICFGIQEKIPCSRSDNSQKKQSSTPSTYLSIPVLPKTDFHNPVRFSLLFFKIVAKQDLETMTFFQEDGES